MDKELLTDLGVKHVGEVSAQPQAGVQSGAMPSTPGILRYPEHLTPPSLYAAVRPVTHQHCLEQHCVAVALHVHDELQDPQHHAQHNQESHVDLPLRDLDSHHTPNLQQETGSRIGPDRLLDHMRRSHIHWVSGMRASG
jgi:hypothetical protein